jgi:hypothetical protein
VIWFWTLLAKLPFWKVQQAQGTKEDEPYKGRVYVVTYKEIFGRVILCRVRYQDELPGEFK